MRASDIGNWTFDQAALRPATDKTAAIQLCDFAQKFDGYLSPIVDIGTVKEIDAAHGDWKPVYDALLALDSEKGVLELKIEPDSWPDQRTRPRHMTTEGRADALGKLGERRKETGKKLLPKLGAIMAAIRKQIAAREEAADQGLVYDDQIKGFLKRAASDPTAEQIALAAEYRAVKRTKAAHSPSDWREEYRQLVTNDDRRARWAEADPVGELVSASDRQWARQWRVEHSVFLPQLTQLRAKERSYHLLFDSALRGFELQPGDISQERDHV